MIALPLRNLLKVNDEKLEECEEQKLDVYGKLKVDFFLIRIISFKILSLLIQVPCTHIFKGSTVDVSE